MAILQLYTRKGAEIVNLPRVCMRCGEQATVTIRKKFSWYPPWIALFLLGGLLLPFFLLMLLLTKYQSIAVPLCEKHRKHSPLFVLSLIFSMLLLSMLPFVSLIIYDNASWVTKSELAPALWGINIGMLAAWLTGIFLFSNIGQIRPMMIANNSITLTNVSPRFIDALEEEGSKVRHWLDQVVASHPQRENLGEERFQPGQDDGYAP